MTQLKLDLERGERAIDILDGQLRRKDVARVQRAVILMMVHHPRLVIIDGNHCLRISFRKASDWCRVNVVATSGMRCGKSAIHNSISLLIAAGVMAVTRGCLWLNPSHLEEWFAAIPEAPTTPVFNRVNALTPLFTEVHE